jgi:hypothetical protein
MVLPPLMTPDDVTLQVVVKEVPPSLISETAVYK